MSWLVRRVFPWGKQQHKEEEEEELFISYGDKSNEELLFGYGFALANNR